MLNGKRAELPKGPIMKIARSSLRTILHLIVILGLLVSGKVTVCSGIDRSDTPSRFVALTIDDLPFVGSYDNVGALRNSTRLLISILNKNQIPAVSFVNEGRFSEGLTLGQRTDILRLWRDGGIELGNHTYSHKSLYRTPLAEFEDEVIRGDVTTRRVLQEKGMRPRYFRYPFLLNASNVETTRAFEEFLQRMGYTVAPVTLDADDYLFAAAYERAFFKGEKRSMSAIVADYVSHTTAMAAFWESLSRKVLGYEIKQILLVHANRLNADHLDKVIEALRGRGYKFISVAEALEDSAYLRKSTYTDPRGISLLGQWARTGGKIDLSAKGNNTNDLGMPEYPARFRRIYFKLLHSHASVKED
jgi:peptidoglycan/xylan/chitin deacetylase (PgdA/CDA1 family)